MNISYKPLWKLLIDRDISSSDLRELTGVAASTFSKMRKNEFVALEILIRICTALDCQISDIAEVVYGERNDKDPQEERVNGFQEN